MKSTVSERGQVTIPKKLREQLGIAPGTVLDFATEGGRLVARKQATRDPVAVVYGILELPGGTDAAIEELRGEPDAT